MSDNIEWCGIMHEILLYPVSYDNTSENGECGMEYIEISGRLPAYGS